jgi:uncharacterized membrane protein
MEDYGMIEKSIHVIIFIICIFIFFYLFKIILYHIEKFLINKSLRDNKKIIGKYMKKTIILLIFSMLFVSCTLSSKKNHLPAQATNIIDKGNGWSQFTLDGKVFLYHKYINGHAGFECITQIK